ncbi:MAG: type II secretion system minor pseudopilin GspI [Chromatiales bacterium]|nr:type II secretion system minor pseudopilin GspI [Chromatiales bacterium]
MRDGTSGAVAGFTLLEVLVALVIVALGLMAAFGQVNQSLTAASRLREKTFAHWIAVDQITRLRLLEQLPALGKSSDEIEMARTRWVYRTVVTKADADALRVVEVSVALSDRPDNVLASVTGIVGTPAPPGTVPSGDWPALEPAS